MTLFTVTFDAESILGVVTGPAGAASLHLRHGEMFCSRLEGEPLGMTVGTFIHAEV